MAKKSAAKKGKAGGAAAAKTGGSAAKSPKKSGKSPLKASGSITKKKQKITKKSGQAATEKVDAQLKNIQEAMVTAAAASTSSSASAKATATKKAAAGKKAIAKKAVASPKQQKKPVKTKAVQSKIVIQMGKKSTKNDKTITKSPNKSEKIPLNNKSGGGTVTKAKNQQTITKNSKQNSEKTKNCIDDDDPTLINEINIKKQETEVVTAWSTTSPSPSSGMKSHAIDDDDDESTESSTTTAGNKIKNVTTKTKTKSKREQKKKLIKKKTSVQYKCTPRITNYEPTEQHLRQVILFRFHLKRSATEIHQDLLEVYGADKSPSLETCAFWVERFKTGDFDLESIESVESV